MDQVYDPVAEGMLVLVRQMMRDLTELGIQVDIGEEMHPFDLLVFITAFYGAKVLQKDGAK